MSDIHAPMGELEQSLIDEFLRERGYDPHAIDALPAAERHALLTQASVHASAKLTEIEARSHYLDEMRAVVS